MPTPHPKALLHFHYTEHFVSPLCFRSRYTANGLRFSWETRALHSNFAAMCLLRAYLPCKLSALIYPAAVKRRATLSAAYHRLETPLPDCNVRQNTEYR